MRLTRNMRPAFTSHEIINGRSANAVDCPKGRVGDVTKTAFFKNFLHLLFSKFYVARFFSKLSRCSIISSSFLSRVPSIVFWGSKKQMIWITARRIVAMMANEHSFGNRTMRQFPSNSMSENSAASVYDPISPNSFNAKPSPRPTGITTAPLICALLKSCLKRPLIAGDSQFYASLIVCRRTFILCPAFDFFHRSYQFTNDATLCQP